MEAARAWLAWDCLGSSLTRSGVDMTDEEAVAAASIGLHLYQEVPKDLRYKSEVLVKRGAKALAGEGVKVRLVVGRQDMLCPPMWAERMRDTVVEEGGQAEVEVVEGAAHSELDKGMAEAMARAVNAVLQM